MIILVVIVLLSLIKLALMAKGYLFVTIDGMKEVKTIPLFCFDSLEIVTHSPRYLSVFVWAFLARARFIGQQDSWNALQYSMIRYIPAYITWLSTCEAILKRELVITMDDALMVVMYMVLRDIELHLAHDDCISWQPYKSIFGEIKPPAESPKKTEKAAEKSASTDNVPHLDEDHVLTLKEKEQVYSAVDSVQKNYLEVLESKHSNLKSFMNSLI